MTHTKLKSEVPKPPEDLRKPLTFGLRPDVTERLKTAAERWGLSRSRFVERAILWYAREIERDPSKLREPEE